MQCVILNNFNCLSYIHVVSVIVVIFAPSPSLGEQKFDGYKIYTGAIVSATSLQDCVRYCLQNQTCSAMSFCNSTTNPSCLLSLCGNIQIVQNSSCTTQSFVGVAPFEGVNLPVVTQEWIATDVCGIQANTVSNTGWFNGPTLNFSSALSSKTYTPSMSYFFGNSVVIGDNTKYSTIAALTNQNYAALFLYFKLLFVNDGTSTSTLNIQYSLQNSTVNGQLQNLSIWISTASIQFKGDFFNCTTSCPVQIVNVNLIIGTWYSLTTILDNTRFNFLVYLNGVQISNTSTKPISADSLLLTVSNSGTLLKSNASVSCIKIFNSTLTPNDIVNIAASCKIGKIAVLTVPYVKNCDGASFTYGGKCYFVYSTAVLFLDAYNLCKSSGYSLLKIDNYTEYQSIRTQMNTLYNNNAPQLWSSLYRSSGVTTDLMWFADNTTISSQLLTSLGSSVSSNDPPPVVYRLIVSSSSMTLSDRKLADSPMYGYICFL